MRVMSALEVPQTQIKIFTTTRTVWRTDGRMYIHVHDVSILAARRRRKTNVRYTIYKTLLPM